MNKDTQPNTAKTGRVLPTVFVFCASAIWGTTFVTQKLAGYHMGSFTYNGLRFALGILSLLPVILIFEKKPDRAKSRRTILAGIGGGGILFIASNLQQFGIILNKEPGSASEAGFITGLYIVFTPLLGLFLGRKARPLVWIAAVLAFGGLALISIGPEGISSIKISDILLVIGAVFWAAHILFIDRFVHSVSPIRFAAVQFAVCSVLCMPSAFLFETVTVQGIYDGILPLLFGGIFACGTAYTFQILGQRGVEPSKAAIIFSLEALFAAVSETVWLGETMTAQKYLGGAVIFIGILLSQMPPRRKN
ncbi:MAG: DMT family transporter [Oscillospiraceae bacterium]|nr:DMT family transporter [Oscillospiraceae bacterium]